MPTIPHNSMLIPVAISLGIIFITILIHGAGTIRIIKYLNRKYMHSELAITTRQAMIGLSQTVVFLMLLHFAEVVLWAVMFLLIPGITQVIALEEAVYFTLTTFTTLGYGDITLGPGWRIMSGFTAMNGIMLFGWSTAMLFSVVQRILTKAQQTGINPPERNTSGGYGNRI